MLGGELRRQIILAVSVFDLILLSILFVFGKLIVLLVNLLEPRRAIQLSAARLDATLQYLRFSEHWHFGAAATSASGHFLA